MLNLIYPQKVKLFCGLIFRSEEYLKKAKHALEKRFGDIDSQSQIIKFNYTDYYEKEMGKGLKRQFVSFRPLINPESLTKAKLYTLKIEKKMSRNKQRLINIDPGYLNEAKVVLASTKDFSHRIYLKHGIFAEITLIYHKKTFQVLSWTFPDYRTPEYHKIFYQIRDAYRQQIKSYPKKQ